MVTINSRISLPLGQAEAQGGALGTKRGRSGLISLAAAASGIGLAIRRTFRNATRLGRATVSPEKQTALARAIYRDHIYCLTAMTVSLGLQLIAQR